MISLLEVVWASCVRYSHGVLFHLQNVFHYYVSTLSFLPLIGIIGIERF